MTNHKRSKPPSPPDTTAAYERTPYAQALRDAAAAYQSHHQRMRDQANAHYEAHPECRLEIRHISWWGDVTRHDDKPIVVKRRLQSNWWRIPALWTDDPPPLNHPQDRPTEYAVMRRLSHTQDDVYRYHQHTAGENAPQRETADVITQEKGPLPV